MAEPAKHFIPEGWSSLQSYITVKNASEAIEFYKKTFQTEEINRMPGENGTVLHAELKIGNSFLMLSDEFPEWGNKSPQTLGGSSTNLCLYVKDCDSVLQKAEESGAKITMAAHDAFWGDRCGNIEDPFGHKWSIMTHKQVLTAEETQANFEKMMASQKS